MTASHNEVFVRHFSENTEVGGVRLGFSKAHIPVIF